MKHLNRLLLLVFSLLLVSGISLNMYNYVYALDEDTVETDDNKLNMSEESNYVSTRINFLDEEDNPLNIEDTISIYKLNDIEDPYVYDEDDNPEISLKVTNGNVEFSNLEEGEIYYFSFDGISDIDNHFYIFKEESEDGSYKYHQ